MFLLCCGMFSDGFGGGTRGVIDVADDAKFFCVGFVRRGDGMRSVILGRCFFVGYFLFVLCLLF